MARTGRRCPGCYYLAVDEGTSDRTVAWGLPAEWSHRCSPGDLVRMRVRPWSRRIVEVEVTKSAGGYGLHGHETSGNLDTLVDEAMGKARPTPLRNRGIQPATLLSPEEVGQALGFAVRARDLGPVSALFETADRGKTVLMVQLMSGTLADLAWRGPKRGNPLPGIADGGAFAHEDGGAARSGDVVVILTLHKDGRQGAAHLPWLLTRAVERLTAASRTPRPFYARPRWARPFAPARTGSASAGLSLPGPRSATTAPAPRHRRAADRGVARTTG